MILGCINSSLHKNFGLTLLQLGPLQQAVARAFIVVDSSVFS